MAGRTDARLRVSAAVVVLLLAAAIGALSAAAPAGAESPSPAKKVVLRIGWLGEPDNMNPFIGWSNLVYEIYANEYLLPFGRNEETIQFDAANGVLESYEVSPDGLTWTLHVNSGITWHDGEPVTAEDVAFTYNYIIDNEMSAFIGFLDGVREAVVVDPDTVEVLCDKPKANFTRLWIPILPEHIWSKIPGEEAGTTYANDPPIIGNGPYQVVEWKKGAYVKMVAYDDYWQGTPTIDEVYYITYDNGDTMVQDLKSGTIDAAYLFPPAQWEALRSTPGIATLEYNWANWDYIGLNCYTGKSHGNPVLLDKDFRTALEYAIDREELVDLAYGGHAWPGYTFMPPKNWKDPDYAWAPPEGRRRDFDPQKAEQLLESAGYVDADGDGIREDKKGKPIELRLWADATAPESQRATKLIAGWWESIGVGVVLSVQDTGVYFDKIWNYDGDEYAPDFDTYYWEWDGYTDPGQTLDCFTTAQIEGWNEFGWSNEEFDRLDVEQNQEMDPDKRAALIHQMQEAMYEDCACIVTAFPLKLEAYRTDKWTGWRRCNYGNGPTFCSQSFPSTFLGMEPVVASEDEGHVGLWIGIGVAAAVVLGAAVWWILRSRRKGPAEEV